MEKSDIQNLIKELIEKTMVKINSIEIVEDSPKNTWFRVEVSEPRFFIDREGEALHALNHLVRRIVENKTPPNLPLSGEAKSFPPDKGDVRGLSESFMIDINGFQKKKVDNVRAIAHI